LVRNKWSEWINMHTFFTVQSGLYGFEKKFLVTSIDTSSQLGVIVGGISVI